MKKLKIALISIAVLFNALTAIAKTEHTVERGETLQSIASKYNITEAQLLEANPGVDQLFYAGLILNIPESIGSNRSLAIRQTTVPETNTYSNDNNEDFDDKPNVAFTAMIEYGFLPKVEGVKGTNYTYAITVGANYFMHRNSGVFAGARIGYNSANYNGSFKEATASYYNMTSEAHFITLPINAGYTFASNNRLWAISPYVGIDANFCVGGKYKQKHITAGSSDKSKMKMDKKVGFDARIGAQLRIFGFNVGVSYVFPLNDNQKAYFGKDSYVAINLGFGF